MENLDDILFDNNLKEKMQKEIKNANNKKNIVKHKKTELKDYSKDEIFTVQTTWKVYNRKNQTESFINGMQAEGLIGIRDDLRHQILTYQTDCFLADDLYIEFYPN